jgi:hypothetical protein
MHSSIVVHDTIYFLGGVTEQEHMVVSFDIKKRIWEIKQPIDFFLIPIFSTSFLWKDTKIISVVTISKTMKVFFCQLTTLIKTHLNSHQFMTNIISLEICMRDKVFW